MVAAIHCRTNKKLTSEKSKINMHTGEIWHIASPLNLLFMLQEQVKVLPLQL